MLLVSKLQEVFQICFNDRGGILNKEQMANDK